MWWLGGWGEWEEVEEGLHKYVNGRNLLSKSSSFFLRSSDILFSLARSSFETDMKMIEREKVEG